jgi:AcrR family transcriptional regulator
MQANHSSSKQSKTPRRTFAETARRAQIVEVAIILAATAGFASVSFARIAKEAGLSSTGIISYNFAGKDDLLREIVAEVMRAASDYIQPRIEAAIGARAKLRAYIEANIAFLAAYPNHLQALVEIMTNLPRDGADRALFVAQMDELLGFHTDYIRDAQAAGEFRAFDPRMMVIAIQGAIDAVVWRKIREPDLDAKRCGRELADLFDQATRNQGTPPCASAT